jgi:Peptidase inhibitor family I36
VRRVRSWDVRCYRTEQQDGKSGIEATTDCKTGWLCVWWDADETGRRLQWSMPGTKKLAAWGSRDQISSAALHRVQSGAELVNYRTLLPNQMAFLGAGNIYDDFRTIGFNDKSDEITVF